MTIDELKAAASNMPVPVLRKLIQRCQLEALTSDNSGEWTLREVALRAELQNRGVTP